MPIGSFLVLTTIGSSIWNTVLVVLGKLAGESWAKIAVYIGGYSDIVITGFIILFVLGIASSYLKKRRKIVFFKLRGK